jgi:Zn-dependent alcohol dehydrogenase
MRVAGITARGEPVEILEVDELAPPAADEVLLDVAAAGIGNWDELVRIGSWQRGGPAPMALGTEAAGTVVAAGSRVAARRPSARQKVPPNRSHLPDADPA